MAAEVVEKSLSSIIKYLLRGNKLITLMATKTSELKQRCFSHVIRINLIRQSTPVAK